MPQGSNGGDGITQGVVALLKAGAANKEIAFALGCKSRTVEVTILSLRRGYGMCAGREDDQRSELVLRLHNRTPENPGSPSRDYAERITRLRAREKAICHLVIRGLAPYEIARQLGIARATVYDYLTNVYVVMGVYNCSGLVSLYCGSLAVDLTQAHTCPRSAPIHPVPRAVSEVAR